VEAPAGYRIKALDAGSDPELAERLVEFWTANRALDERTARARLGEVMCVLEAEDGGAIVGVNSAYAAEAPVVGRPFWIYRRFVLPAVGPRAEAALLVAGREALAARFAGAEDEPDEPVGLCVLVADRGVIERYPEAVWETGFLFAGYTEEGVAVRISYFDGAKI